MAAVGSLMMSMTFSPAIFPASCVALRRNVVEVVRDGDDGVGDRPDPFFASCLSFLRIRAEMNSGVSLLPW